MIGCLTDTTTCVVAKPLVIYILVLSKMLLYLLKYDKIFSKKVSLLASLLFISTSVMFNKNQPDMISGPSSQDGSFVAIMRAVRCDIVLKNIVLASYA